MYNIVKWKTTNSLIHVLKLNNEDFDEQGIKENIYVHGANDRTKNTPVH